MSRFDGATLGGSFDEPVMILTQAEVDRLRAENAALAAALEDIAGMRVEFSEDRPHSRWLATAECASMGLRCTDEPDEPGEWCPVCVAEVAWCAWKMGVLGG